MRASKESAEQAYQALIRLSALAEEPQQQEDVDTLETFLKRAKRKLPSEAAYDADAARKARVRELKANFVDVSATAFEQALCDGRR
jgi:hypothetical protein